jgi:hypothetical protein
LYSRRPIWIRFVINQSPGTVLLSVFSSSSGIMFFDPASQVVGMPDVEFVCLKTLKYIHVIHEYTLFKYTYCIVLTITVSDKNQIQHKLQKRNFPQDALRRNQRPSLRDALTKLSYSPTNQKLNITHQLANYKLQQIDRVYIYSNLNSGPNSTCCSQARK